MKEFKKYAEGVVESIIEYIKSNSSLDNLDLSVGNIEFNVRSPKFKDDYKVTSYKCKIFNNSLETDNTILVNVSLYDDDYTLDIFSRYFHNFGISAIISDLNITPDSDYSVSVDVCYTEELDTSSGTDVFSDSFSGTLLVQSSSYVPTFSLGGKLLLSEKLSYDLVLDLVRKFLHRSHLVFGAN